MAFFKSIRHRFITKQEQQNPNGPFKNLDNALKKISDENASLKNALQEIQEYYKKNYSQFTSDHVKAVGEEAFAIVTEIETLNAISCEDRSIEKKIKKIEGNLANFKKMNFQQNNYILGALIGIFIAVAVTAVILLIMYGLFAVSIFVTGAVVSDVLTTLLIASTSGGIIGAAYMKIKKAPPAEELPALFDTFYLVCVKQLKTAKEKKDKHVDVAISSIFATPSPSQQQENNDDLWCSFNSAIEIINEYLWFEKLTGQSLKNIQDYFKKNSKLFTENYIKYFGSSVLTLIKQIKETKNFSIYKNHYSSTTDELLKKIKNAKTALANLAKTALANNLKEKSLWNNCWLTFKPFIGELYQEIKHIKKLPLPKASTLPRHPHSEHQSTRHCVKSQHSVRW